MPHSVLYALTARNDLQKLTDWITGEAGSLIAGAYVDLIRARCQTLEDFPRRGSLRRHRPETHSIPFRRSATIVYRVIGSNVVIIRILHRGRDVERDIASLV